MESKSSIGEVALTNTLPNNPLTDDDIGDNSNVSSETEINLNGYAKTPQKDKRTETLNTEISPQGDCNIEDDISQAFQGNISSVPTTVEKHISITEFHQLHNIEEESGEEMESQHVKALDRTIEMTNDDPTLLSEIKTKSDDDVIANILNYTITNTKPYQDVLEKDEELYDTIQEDVTTDFKTDVTMDITTDVTTYITKDVTTDVTKDITTNVTADVTTDITKDVRTGVTTYVTPDITKDVTTDITTDVPMDVTPDITKDVTTDITNDVPTDVTTDITTDVTTNVTTDIPKDVTTDLTTDAISNVKTNDLALVPPKESETISPNECEKGLIESIQTSSSLYEMFRQSTMTHLIAGSLLLEERKPNEDGQVISEDNSKKGINITDKVAKKDKSDKLLKDKINSSRSKSFGSLNIKPNHTVSMPQKRLSIDLGIMVQNPKLESTTVSRINKNFLHSNKKNYAKISKPPLVRNHSTSILTNNQPKSTLPGVKRHSTGEIMNRVKPQLPDASKELLKSEFIRSESDERLSRKSYGKESEPQATVDIIFIEKSQTLEANNSPAFIDLRSDQEYHEDINHDPNASNSDKDNLDIETGKTTEMESEISPSLDQSVELSELMKNDTDIDKFSEITEKEFSEISEMVTKKDLDEEMIAQFDPVQETAQKEETFNADQTEIIDKCDEKGNDSEKESLNTLEENNVKYMSTESNNEELENNDTTERNNDLNGSKPIIEKCLEPEEKDILTNESSSYNEIEIENSITIQQEVQEKDEEIDNNEIEEKQILSSSEVLNLTNPPIPLEHVNMVEELLFDAEHEENLPSNIIKSLISEMIDNIVQTSFESPLQSSEIIKTIFDELLNGFIIDPISDPIANNDQGCEPLMVSPIVADILYEIIDTICSVNIKSDNEPNDNEEVKELETDQASLPIETDPNKNTDLTDVFHTETASESKQSLQDSDPSSQTESNLDPKIEGRKMRINQRPKKKEIKISKENVKKPSTPKDISDQPRRNQERKQSITKVLKKSQKRMSLDLGSKLKKEPITRKLSDMTLGKLSRDFSEVISDTISDPENKENLDLNEVKTHEEIISTLNEIDVQEKENISSKEQVEEIEKEVTNEYKSTETMEGSVIETTDGEALEQPNEPGNAIIEQAVVKPDNLNVVEESQSQPLNEMNIKNVKEKEPEKLLTKKSGDEDIITVIKRRLSLNQPSTNINETAVKLRSMSTTSKPRPLKRYASLVQLSLERSSEKLLKSNEEITDTDKIKEEMQTVNKFIEEAEKDLNHENENEECNRTAKDEEADRSLIAPPDEEEDFFTQNEIKVTTIMKDECNENEINEDKKSKTSSVHTVTIEVRDETSEIIGESEVLNTEENKPWIIENWDCDPDMKNDETIKEETMKKPEEIQKPSQPIKVNDVKFELRKKIKTTNYKPAPVENYFTKPSDNSNSKLDKQGKQDLKVKIEVKHDPNNNPKDKPSEPIEKKSEKPFAKLQRKKLKEPILDKTPQKKYKPDETEKMDKSNPYTNSYDLEFRRIKSNIETLKSHIEHRKQKPKEHVPFVFNDLQPYGDTHMYEKFRHQKPTSAYGAVTRRTAMDLCEPWESFEMDKIILPPIRVSSSYMSSRSPLPSKRSARRDKSVSENKTSHRSDFGNIDPIKEPSKSFIYSDRKYKSQSNHQPLPSSRIEDDYNKTKTDLYRLSLNRINSSKSIRSKSAIRSALFAYLQNSPGSKRALYEVIHNIDKEQ